MGAECALGADQLMITSVVESAVVGMLT